MISFIADVIEEISSAFKYAEYEFYKLISDVNSLLDQASRHGYHNPSICSFTIKRINKSVTSVTIEAYYDKGNRKYHKFSKKLDIGELKNVPLNVCNRLNTDKELTIKLSDMETFRSINQEEIIPTIHFNDLYNFKLKNIDFVPDKKELHITDNLFYYKVVLVYKYQDGGMDSKIIYCGYIQNLPSEINDKISSSSDRSCFIDVTNPL